MRENKGPVNTMPDKAPAWPRDTQRVSPWQPWRPDHSFGLKTALTLTGMVLVVLISGIERVVPATSTSPYPLDALYDVHASGAVVGQFSFKVSRPGDNTDSNEFLLESSMQPSGIGQLLASGPLLQLSHFTVQNGRVVPQSYHETRPGEDPPDTTISFDWDGMTVKLPNGEILPIPQRPLDPASAPLQVILTPPSAERNLDVNVISKRGARLHTFKLTGESTLETAIGTMKTLEIREQSQGADPGNFVKIWLAPERGFVPVKIERHRKGIVIAFTLSKLNASPEQL